MSRRSHLLSAPGARPAPGLAALTLAVLVVVPIPTLAPPALTAQEVQLPGALRKLTRLEGRWTTDRVEFLDEGGRVIRTSPAHASNELQMDGLVLAHQGRLEEPTVATRGWYYWNQDDDRLHMGSVATPGRYDEFVGGWQGDRLVMMTLPSEAYDGRLFRMTHHEITKDSYRERLEVSEDGGETWRVSSRQRMRRVGAGRIAEAEPVLSAMDAYVGHWTSDRKTGPQGDAFHFEYDLRWLDAGRTMAEMRITQHLTDGTERLVFEGVKGREPDGTGVYYWAVSPAGRGSRGTVHLEGEGFVTVYEGWTADGSVVEIRDVFTPVEEDRFVSRTYLRGGTHQDWRQIGEDHWERQG